MKALIVVALLFTGCASSTPIVMGKLDGDNSQWKRDDYECARETRQVVGGSGIAGMLAAIEADREANRDYVTCMELRGYERK